MRNLHNIKDLAVISSVLCVNFELLYSHDILWSMTGGSGGLLFSWHFVEYDRRSRRVTILMTFCGVWQEEQEGYYSHDILWSMTGELFSWHYVEYDRRSRRTALITLCGVWQKEQESYKGTVFYGQEPPSGESTTTECWFNYQLLAVIYWSSPMGSS